MSARTGISSTRSRSGGIEEFEALQTVVEIAPKLALVDHRLERPIASRDDAHVAASGLVDAQRLDLAFLQKTQQAHLKCWRDFGDLVEENRTAIGSAEQAEPVADRAGKGATLVAEQLRLQQVVGKRTAVLHHEAAARSGAEEVDRAREQLLAGAGFALNQHWQIGAAALRRAHKVAIFSLT